jgi:hypothetical protein
MALDYKELFGTVKAELARIRNKEANLENELASTISEREAMETTYNALAPLVGESPLPTLKSVPKNVGIEVLEAAGISVAVRALLDASPLQNFTAAAVRDHLAMQGWNWERYTNPQATVYTTLVRLASGTNAAIRETTIQGKKAFYSAVRDSIAPPPIAPPPVMAIPGFPPVGDYTPNILSLESDPILKRTIEKIQSTLAGPIVPITPLPELFSGEKKKK